MLKCVGVCGRLCRECGHEGVWGRLCGVVSQKSQGHPPPTHSLSHTHTLTHSLSLSTDELTNSQNSLTNSELSLTHSLYSQRHFLTHELTNSRTHELTHLRTRALTHSRTHELHERTNKLTQERLNEPSERSNSSSLSLAHSLARAWLRLPFALGFCSSFWVLSVSWLLGVVVLCLVWCGVVWCGVVWCGVCVSCGT